MITAFKILFLFCSLFLNFLLFLRFLHHLSHLLLETAFFLRFLLFVGLNLGVDLLLVQNEIFDDQDDYNINGIGHEIIPGKTGR